MTTSTEDPTEPHFIHQAIEWTGTSGTRYRYYIWPRGAKIEGNPPGNFLHVKVADDGTLAPVYIGQTDDLNRRLLSKEEEESVNANQATQLHIRTSYQGEHDRLTEKYDLMACWQPVCNISLREVYLKTISAEVAAN